MPDDDRHFVEKFTEKLAKKLNVDPGFTIDAKLKDTYYDHLTYQGLRFDLSKEGNDFVLTFDGREVKRCETVYEARNFIRHFAEEQKKL